MSPHPEDVQPAPRELRGHIPALDGLRGLAVLLVLVFHIAQSEAQPAGGVARMLYGATRLGQTGVDLFFVLSGFLITGILFETKPARRFFVNFYGRRTLRIFPLYYGVLIVAFLIVPAVFGVRPAESVDQAWLWTYTSNLPASWGEVGGMFGHFWTLAIEEQFYLIWPAVVYALGRTRLMKVCLGCIVGALGVRILLEMYGLSSFTFTLARMDSLTLGAWIALAARGSNGLAGWKKIAWAVAITTAGLTAPLYLAASGSGAAWLQVIKPLPIALLYGSILVLAITSGWVSRCFQSKTLRWFGKYSYALYVFHPLLIQVAGHLTEGSNAGRLAVLERVAIVVVGSMVAALLSWNLYEKHFLVWKSLFVDSKEPLAIEMTSVPISPKRTTRGVIAS